jgi:hypothetical protein
VQRYAIRGWRSATEHRVALAVPCPSALVAGARTELVADRGLLSADQLTVFEQTFVTAIRDALLPSSAVAAAGVLTSTAHGSESDGG